MYFSLRLTERNWWHLNLLIRSVSQLSFMRLFYGKCYKLPSYFAFTQPCASSSGNWPVRMQSIWYVPFCGITMWFEWQDDCREIVINKATLCTGECRDSENSGTAGCQEWRFWQKFSGVESITNSCSLLRDLQLVWEASAPQLCFSHLFEKWKMMKNSHPLKSFK